MKERPILFSAPMVRARLAGTKTQTRRPLKPQPAPNHPHDGGTVWVLKDGLHVPVGSVGHLSMREKQGLRSPYGQPGDRLWVRETFALERSVEPDQPLPHSDGRPVLRRPEDDIDCVHPLWKQPHYRATDRPPELMYEQGPAGGREDEVGVRWKPPIHMPRWASRITLEIAAVRVELLQDISREDAMAEGIVLQPDGGYGLADTTHYHATDPRQSYFSLWEAINGRGSVEANPWVWTVTFSPASPTTH